MRCGLPRLSDFQSCRRTGAVGVLEARKFLEGLPNTLGVLSLENDRRFFSWNLDLLWLHYEETGFLVEPVEVKTDTWDTGNIYLELVSNDRSGKEGWLFTSRARWLAYHIVPLRFFAMLDLPALRNWYRNSRYTQKRFHKETWTRSGASGYRSIGVPCPSGEILAEVPHLLRPPQSEIQTEVKRAG
jgi:hypothetical protein